MSRNNSFSPYANEAEVLEVGNLMLENRLDRITISGELDLTADKLGLRDARRLHAALGAIVAALEARALPDQLPPPVIERVDNPFT
ncbi:MAG: hypothetical protein ACREWI_06890 [Telluria sp.]